MAGAGMWNESLVKAALVRGPTEPNQDDEDGEITLNVSGTSDRWEIPAWLAGRYAEFTASGANIDFLFGDSAVDVVYDQASTVSTETITPHANSGRRIIDGQTRSWVVPVPSKATHFAAEASGAGTLHIGLASVRMEK